MVVLIAFLQSAQYADGTQLIGLVDHHGLEAALQCLVFLEVFLVFIQRCCADGPQFASGQRRLQNVGCVHGTFATASTHEGVNLVNEQDDAPIALRHLVDDALQAFLELSLVLGTSHQRTHVKRIELLVLQILWHVATYNSPGQTLNDGCFTCARLTYQYRIVFCSAGKNLQHTANLIVTPNDGVQLACASQTDKIFRILLQALIVIFSALALLRLTLTQFQDGLLQIP